MTDKMDGTEAKKLYGNIRLWLEKHRELGYPDVYSAVCTDEDRFKLTLGIINERDVLHLPHSFEGHKQVPEKDLATCKYFGQSADKFLRPKKNIKKKDTLLEHCTKALAFAPTDSKEVALAYGRRARALFLVRLYEDSINDVDRAFQLGYPPTLQSDLFLIKLKCLLAIHGADSSIVLEAIDATRKLSKTNDTPYQRSRITIALAKLSTQVFEDPFEKWNDHAFLPVVSIANEDKNAEIPGASPAIAISYSAKYGRHIVATQDIEIGQVLAVEKPHAAVLELTRRYINCWYCLIQTWSGIPCDTCPNVVYCSQQCKELAWKEFHDVECNVLGIFIIENLNNGSMMSIRLLIKAFKEYGGWQLFKERLEEINNCPDFRAVGFTSGILDTSKYASVGTLVANTEKRTMEDLFTFSVGSVMITYILATRTKLFGREFAEFDGESLLRDPSVVFAGGVILRHLQIHAINSQMLCEWDPKENNSFTRAMALIPLYGLMNHSCNPSVTYTGHGRFMAMHAIRPIKKGEQIFDDRGVHYGNISRELRQLKRREDSFFFCECIACQENWPLFQDLPTYTTMNLNPIVKKKLDEIMCAESFFTVMKNHSMLEVDKMGPIAIATVIEHLKTMYKYLQQPCREIDEITRTLQYIYRQITNRCQTLGGR